MLTFPQAELNPAENDRQTREKMLEKTNRNIYPVIHILLILLLPLSLARLLLWVITIVRRLP